AFPSSRSTLTTRGWNSGILVRSMPNDHTASNGALMMISCLDRNGGRITIPRRERGQQAYHLAESWRSLRREEGRAPRLYLPQKRGDVRGTVRVIVRELCTRPA